MTNLSTKEMVERHLPEVHNHPFGISFPENVLILAKSHSINCPTCRNYVRAFEKTSTKKKLVDVQMAKVKDLPDKLRMEQIQKGKKDDDVVAIETYVKEHSK